MATSHYIVYRDDWHQHPAILGGRVPRKQRNSPLFRPLLFRCFRAVMPAVLSLFSTEKDEVYQRVGGVFERAARDDRTITTPAPSRRGAGRNRRRASRHHCGG